MSKPLRIAFMGTPQFALPVLKALVESNHSVVCVYTQPPRPKGRGGKVQKSPVHELADEYEIKVLTTKSLKGADEINDFKALDLDLAIVAAYGLILPRGILSVPRLGCWNIHASLLPRWRGASPIQRAIWAGDETSGVCLMQMDEGLDTGDVLLQREVKISDTDDALSLSDKLSILGAQMTLDALDAGNLCATRQSQKGAVYAKMLKKSDGLVDWSRSAIEIDRQIRALNPWPSVTDEARGIKILKARALDEKTNKKAGLLLDKEGRIACGDGSVLKLITVQPSGRKAMDVKSAINGGYL